MKKFSRKTSFIILLFLNLCIWVPTLSIFISDSINRDKKHTDRLEQLFLLKTEDVIESEIRYSENKIMKLTTEDINLFIYAAKNSPSIKLNHPYGFDDTYWISLKTNDTKYRIEIRIHPKDNNAHCDFATIYLSHHSDKNEDDKLIRIRYFSLDNLYKWLYENNLASKDKINPSNYELYGDTSTDYKIKKIREKYE